MKKTTTNDELLTMSDNDGRIDEAQVGDRVRSFDFGLSTEAVEGVVTEIQRGDGFVRYTIAVDTDWMPINNWERGAPSRPLKDGECKGSRVGATTNRFVRDKEWRSLPPSGFVNLSKQDDGEEADPAAAHPVFPHRDVRGRFTQLT